MARRSLEHWLTNVWACLAPRTTHAVATALGIDAVELHPVPFNVQLTVGFYPDRKMADLAWAYTHSPDASRDDTTWTVFLSPKLAGDHRRTTLCLGVLLHEQLHCTLTCEHGHNRRFQRVAQAAGFRSPYTVTSLKYMNADLLRYLRSLTRAVGKCPWVPLREP